MVDAKQIGIVSVMEGVPWGGSEMLWHDMVQEAIRIGYKINISYKGWDPLPHRLEELKKNGALIYYRNNSSVYPSLKKRIVGRLLRDKERLKKSNLFKPFFELPTDVFLISEGAFADVLHFPDLTNLLVREERPYFILSEQNKEYGSIRKERLDIARNIFNRAKKCYFVSEGNKDVAEFMLGQRLVNAEVVKNPVNLSDLPLKPLEFPPLDKVKIACVGRLDVEQKGQDLLLRALSKITESYNYEVSFYGSGDDEEYLKQLTQFFNLEDKVSFKGFEKDVKKIWLSHHLLVLFSHREGMPLTVVEAMLCGRPCLVTDVAGNAEWIKDGFNGYIVKSHNIDILAEKLKTVLAEHSRYSDIGRNAFYSANKQLPENAGRELLEKVLAI